MKGASYMDELVDKIITLDKEGQARINALEKEKQELSSYIKMMREKLGTKYKGESKEAIEKIELSLKSDYELRVEKSCQTPRIRKLTLPLFMKNKRKFGSNNYLSFALTTKD